MVSLFKILFFYDEAIVSSWNSCQFDLSSKIAAKITTSVKEATKIVLLTDKSITTPPCQPQTIRQNKDEYISTPS